MRYFLSLIIVTLMSVAYAKESSLEQDKHDEIILLSTKGCYFCAKTKNLLDEQGKSYRELNVYNSDGARLFKKYNGKGVPIIIVGSEVIRGYNPKKILEVIDLKF